MLDWMRLFQTFKNYWRRKMSESEQITKLIELENLLNEYSGKRYHFKAGDDWLFSIVEVEKIGKEKLIVKDLTLDQLYGFIKKNIKITLKPQVIGELKNGS